jgi:hypothetical protein
MEQDVLSEMEVDLVPARKWKKREIESKTRCG